MGDLWAIDAMPRHLWLMVWYSSGWLSHEELTVLGMTKWQLGPEELSATWRGIRNKIRHLAEDSIDLEVPAACGSRDYTPFMQEQQDVYQVGELGTGQGWRTLHVGLQHAIKREAAKRLTAHENQVFSLTVVPAYVRKLHACTYIHACVRAAQANKLYVPPMSTVFIRTLPTPSYHHVYERTCIPDGVCTHLHTIHSVSG
jgi:hypothetical protein